MTEYIDISTIPPTPRKVSKEARSIFFRFKPTEQLQIFYAFIPVLVLGILLLPFTFLLRNSLTQLLIDSGWKYQKVPAKITAKQKNKTNNNNGKTFILYGIRFQYKIGKKTYKNVQFIWEMKGNPQFRKGQKIEVECSSLLPRFARIVGLHEFKERSRTILFIIFTLVILLLYLFGYWLAKATKAYRQRKWLSRNGLAASALLTELTADQDTLVSGQHPIKLLWEFEVSGKKYEGFYSTMSKKELTIIGKDKIYIPILYHPKDPTQSIPYL